MELYSADHLIIGKITTLDESGELKTYEALTVKDGLIQYAGTLNEAKKYCNDETRISDYTGAYLYPGMLEGHCHGSMAGNRLTLEVSLTDGECEEDYIEAVKAFIEANPDFPEYRGAGWKGSAVSPSKETLDKICPDKAVYLNSFDGHSMWLNSKALEQSGIDKAAAKKWGPDIVRVNPDGTPTGYISEGPCNAMLASVKYTHEQKKKALLNWQEFAFSKGFTAVLDAGVTERIVELYDELVKEGKWKLRTYAVYLIPETADDYPSYIEKAKELSEKYNSEYFKIIGMKVFMDGVVEAHTAWLIDDYTDTPGKTGVRRMCDETRFAEVVAESAKAGFMVHAHTVGDGAIKFALDGIEEGKKANPSFDMRNALAHLQVVDNDQLDRIEKLGVVPVVAPLWCIKADFGIWDQEVSYLGQQRADNAYPVKSFFDRGCKAAFHSDYPVSSSVSVPGTVFCAVERRLSNQSTDKCRNASECISREQALSGLTTNPAYSFYEENRLGKLLPGYVANLSIYDRDLINDDIELVDKANTVAVIIDGEEVYHA